MDPKLKTLVLPGGRLPFPAKTGDVGFDAFVRAVVDVKMSERVPYMRQTLINDPQWEFILRPKQKVCLGLGIVFGQSTQDWSAELAPRSSTALLELGIMSHLNKVPIDPNFRSEPIVFLANYGDEPFYIHHGDKLVQLKFYCRCCPAGYLTPELEEVSSYEELGTTVRGILCHGSSDLIVA